MDWEDSGAIRRLFHGGISREEAEERLLRHASAPRRQGASGLGGGAEGLYLVRESPRHSRSSFILSFTAFKKTLQPRPCDGAGDDRVEEELRRPTTATGEGERRLGVTHWQVNVNRYSKVEGFFFINKPNRVSLTFDALLADAASAEARSPLLCSDEEAVQSAWWAELMLCRVTDDDDDADPLHASTWRLPEDLAVAILSLLDRASLAAMHLVCKQFYAVARDSSVWRALYRKDFGRRVPQIQLAASDIDWKLKYHLDHALLTGASEPRVIGLSVLRGIASRITSPCRFSSYSIEYSTQEPNVFCFVSPDPTIFNKARCSADTLVTGTIPIYRIKSGYKAGYSLEREPASLGNIYPSLQKLITFIRIYMCLVDPFPLAFGASPGEEELLLS